MDDILLKLYRHTFNTEGDINIIGDLHILDEFFCYTLEDQIRAEGVKVYGDTCIDADIYDFIISYSPKFKRDMILILDVPRFSGIRMHGGNRSKDTLGCPLVAFETDYKRIWMTAEKKLTAKVKELGGKGKIQILNAPFTYDKELHKLRPEFL